VDTDKLAALLHAAVAEAVEPLRAEIASLRRAIEARFGASDAAVSEPPPYLAGAPSPLTVTPAGGRAMPPAAPQLESPTPDRLAEPTPPVALRAARPEPRPESNPDTRPHVALFTELLHDYPGDAAAVYFAFDRQHRCGPEYLDRLARGGDLEELWHAANRTTIHALIERYHGGIGRVAEMLARDTDSFLALVDRLGLRGELNYVRGREQTRLAAGDLGERLGHVLYRQGMLADLGILADVDTRTRDEVRRLCAEIAGEADDVEAVLEQLGHICGLDAGGMDKLERRYDLRRFVADLFETPENGDTSTFVRAPRRAAPRHHDDATIEARILRMLLAKGKVGAAHTHVGHLLRTVPRHERGRARDIVDRLVSAGILMLKTTDNSAEAPVSLAVDAVAEAEARLASPVSTRRES
jgi:hypothetical protein